MLKDKDSSAIVAVTDLDRARKFYGDTLGLPLVPQEMPQVLVYQTGATRLTVYPSKFAGTNQANAVCWGVGDELDAIVADLKAKGVTFEHYEDVGKLEGDVHVAGSLRLVWLKDPDGNILHLLNA